jgi:hypothetical protein
VSASQQNAEYPKAESGAADELRDALPPSRWLIDEGPSPEQIEIYRRMTPGRRLEIAEQLYWSARRMKSAWLKSLHPDWTEQQVEAEVTCIFSHARS